MKTILILIGIVLAWILVTLLVEKTRPNNPEADPHPVSMIIAGAIVLALTQTVGHC